MITDPDRSDTVMSPRRFSLLLAVLAASLLLVSACGSEDGEAGTDADGTIDDALPDDASSGDGAGGDASRPWIAGAWVLESATATDGPLSLPPGTPLPLSITGPDGIEGNAGCNGFSGRINAPFDGVQDGGSLSISQLSMTEMGCEHLDFEIRYFELLAGVDEWALAPPSGLVFRGDGIELVYTVGAPPAERPLEGTTWIFDTVFSGEGIERTASSTRADQPEVTALLLGGVLTLSAEGCSPVEINVGYEPGGVDGAFTIEEPESLAGRVDCADQESNLVAAVDGVAQSTGFQIFAGRLTLIGLPGETVSFRAADGES